ncbi:hypothetical protein EA528_23050 [Salmonella enterica]|nr:hypothetical protein [Salmonella enterica subsp. enterica serovar Give]EAU5206363.1 hypothetical protein [Salmonella enterica subsp. enterica serovar Oranienburg]
MKISEIFANEQLKNNEKLFLIYLHMKGCHKKERLIDTVELEKAMSLSYVSLWRIKDSLLKKGLITIARETSNAIQEYKLNSVQDQNETTSDTTRQTEEM